jgi:ribosomal-protein-alanine N-acetyltransferase
MNAPELLMTARLEGRRVGHGDEDFVRAIFGDDRVAATLGGARDGVRVTKDLARWDAHWREHGFGMWILHDRSSDEPVGWTMLTATDTGGHGGVEVGWTIIADRWREGLAFEAGAEATRIAFGVLGRDALVSLTQPHNVASRGVMEKIGFRYDGDVEHAGLPHVLYRLDRTTWEKTHG